MQRAMRYGFYIILCLLLALAGCEATPKYGAPVTNLTGSEVGSAKSARDDRRDDTTQRIDAERSDPEDLEAAEIEIKATHAPVDPGAEWLVAKLRDVLQAELARADRPTAFYISTFSIRNQSKAQCDEFDAMLVRLAELLDAAGSEEGLRFTADAARSVDYHLKGAAYLVTAEGFDLWELYLSLRPSDRAWTLWQADAPVRLLRSTRLRGQQMFPPIPDSR